MQQTGMLLELDSKNCGLSLESGKNKEARFPESLI